MIALAISILSDTESQYTMGGSNNNDDGQTQCLHAKSCFVLARLVNGLIRKIGYIITVLNVTNSIKFTHLNYKIK